VASTLGGQPEVVKEGMLTSATVTQTVETDRAVLPRPPIKIGYPYDPRDLRGVIQREHLVGSFSFGPANTRGQKLYSLSLPGVFYGFPNIMSKLGNFAFYRAGAEVRIKVIGNLAVAGKLRVGYLKNCNFAEIDADIHYDDLAWMDPHIIDVQSSNDLVIKIPWFSNILTHPLPFSSLTQCDIAYLCVFCEHTLESADATQPNLTIQVYAKLEDMEFYGDIADHSLTMNSKLASLERRDKEAVVKKLLAELEAETQSTVSDALGKVVSAAFSSGDEPPKPLKTVGDIISSSMPNLDVGMLLCKPVNPSVPQLVTVTHLHDTQTSTGVANLPVYGFKSNVQKNIDAKSLFQDYKKFETLNDIGCMPSPVAYASMDSSSVPGALLLQIPVCPSFALFLDGTGHGAHTPTPAQSIAMMHQFWRGSMKYSLLISGTQMASAKLGINYYPVTAALPADNTERLAAHGEILGMVLDLHGSTTKDFTIPYLNNVPVISNLAPDQIGDLSNAGYLQIFVIQPPATSGSAGTYQITVEAAPGEDSQWFVPTTTYGTFGSSPATQMVPNISPIVTWTYTQSMSNHFNKDFPMFDTAVSVSPGPLIALEEVKSLKELYCLPTNWCTFGTFSGIIVAPGQPSSASATGEPQFTREYFTMFRGWRGSRYVWVDITSSDPTAPCPFVGIWADTNALLGPSYQRLDRHPLQTQMNVGAPRTRYTDRGFVIPWACPRGLFAQNSFCRYGLIFSEGPVEALWTSYGGSGSVILAYGDDFQFGGLCPPRQWLFPNVPSLSGKSRPVTRIPKSMPRSEFMALQTRYLIELEEKEKKEKGKEKSSVSSIPSAGIKSLDDQLKGLLRK
jgi:hypothetical protein